MMIPVSVIERFSLVTLCLLIACTAFLKAQPAHAQLNQRAAIFDEIGVDEKLGDTIPMDLEFVNSEGDTVTIADLMIDGKPVLLNPLYYECPMLCNLVVEAVYDVVKQLRWSPGSDYTIISFSINPDETVEQAAESKERYLSSLDREGAEDGWHFLVGEEPQIKALTDAVGFKYTVEERTGEYLHSASIIFLSPDGMVTRYLHGIEFEEFALRNALHESADGKIGTILDQAILFCFTYDPDSESYIPVALNIMKLGGFVTLIILGAFLLIFWRRERRSSSSSPSKQSQTFEIIKE